MVDGTGLDGMEREDSGSSRDDACMEAMFDVYNDFA